MIYRVILDLGHVAGNVDSSHILETSRGTLTTE
jgi:hypothetical protein